MYAASHASQGHTVAIKALVAEKANDSAKNTVLVGKGFKVLGGRAGRAKREKRPVHSMLLLRFGDLKPEVEGGPNP